MKSSIVDGRLELNTLLPHVTMTDLRQFLQEQLFVTVNIDLYLELDFVYLRSSHIVVPSQYIK